MIRLLEYIDEKALSEFLGRNKNIKQDSMWKQN